MPDSRLTPNQIVAWNLSRARQTRGWTQEQASEQLEPYLGERWSKATFSAAERSFDGTRIRQFTADDLYAFSRCFDLPIAYFLRPPTWIEEVGHANSTESTSRAGYLDMLFDVGSNANEWLLHETVPLSAGATRAIRRWGSNFAAVIAQRDREVDEFLRDAQTQEDQS